MQSKNLLNSWQRIWSAFLRGDNPAYHQALNDHVAQFSGALQPEALNRAQRIVETHRGNTTAIRIILARYDTTLAGIHTSAPKGGKPRAHADAA